MSQVHKLKQHHMVHQTLSAVVQNTLLLYCMICDILSSVAASLSPRYDALDIILPAVK